MAKNMKLFWTITGIVVGAIVIIGGGYWIYTTLSPSTKKGSKAGGDDKTDVEKELGTNTTTSTSTATTTETKSLLDKVIDPIKEVISPKPKPATILGSAVTAATAANAEFFPLKVGSNNKYVKALQKLTNKIFKFQNEAKYDTLRNAAGLPRKYNILDSTGTKNVFPMVADGDYGQNTKLAFQHIFGKTEITMQDDLGYFTKYKAVDKLIA